MDKPGRCLLAGAILPVNDDGFMGSCKASQQAASLTNVRRWAIQYIVLITEQFRACQVSTQGVHAPHMAQAIDQSLMVQWKGMVILTVVADQATDHRVVQLPSPDNGKPGGYR